MSRLLGAAYGVLCMVLLAPPLALMRAGRDVESGRVSMGRQCTDMCLLRYTKPFHDEMISSGVECLQAQDEIPELQGIRISIITSHAIMKFHFRRQPNVPQCLNRQFLINKEMPLAVYIDA